MPDIFDSTAPVDATLETLVGDDKKYKTGDDLAKAKVHADRTIAAREQELATLREELNRRLAAEDLLAAVESRMEQRQPPNGEQPGGTPPAPAPEPVIKSDDDLVKRVREITERDNAERKRKANVDEVASRLTEVFGSSDKANEVVNQRARELGVSVTFLQEAAAQSPKAFYAQLGLDNSGNRPQGGATRSDVNTEALSTSRGDQGSGRTYSYYQRLMKEKPAEYFTPKIQNQLMKDAFAASEQGRDFYKT